MSPEPILTLDELRLLIEQQGFSGFSITDAAALPNAAAHLEDWLKAGLHGGMHYLSKPAVRDQPSLVMENAKSIISVAMNYNPGGSSTESAERKQPFIARYARGNDYHRVIKARLKALAHALEDATEQSVVWRACVDTAPLLERDYAAAGGLGFIAKSTMLITPGVGSYTLLGELLVDASLPTTTSIRERCGSCTQCIVDCPTQAFIEPRVLDARKCISYWTIETRASIPIAIREVMENMVFGCDRCQEVCPFNASSKLKIVDNDLKPIDKLTHITLVDLLNLTTSDHKRLVRGTAMERAARDQLMRNAAVAMGNSASRDFVAPLARAMNDNRYPVVREHCAWALGKLGGSEAKLALEALLNGSHETDETVREAARSALHRANSL